MLKAILLASAFTISAPAFAQEAPVTPSTAPETTPQQSAPAVTPADPVATPAPTDGTMSQAETATATPTTEAQPAAAGATQIAQVVNSEFASYDKNANGDLDKGEFGAWMVALKTASDPATKAADPTTQTWVGQAFASADKDKSAAVTKEELTSFLSQGAE